MEGIDCKNVGVECGVIKLVWPQEKRTRLKRKFIIFTGPRKGVTICHAGPQGKAPVLVRKQKGTRGRPRPQTSLGFLQEKQDMAG